MGFYQIGLEDGKLHALKYGVYYLELMIDDYIKTVDCQNSWDDDERDFVRGLKDALTQLKAA